MKHTTRYLVEKQGAHGPLWYWQPAAALRKLGWHPQRLLVNSLAEAIERAEELNRELDAKRLRQVGELPPHRHAAGTVRALITDFKASEWWAKLKPRTQRDYGHCLAVIDRWAGDTPARAITPVAVQAFYNGLAKRVEGRGRNRKVIETLARAAAIVRVLSVLLNAGRLMSAGHGQAYVTSNAAERPKISTERQREPQLWTRPMLAHMMHVADTLGWRSQATSMLLGFWTGQRQEDILTMRSWTKADGTLVLRQGKTGRHVPLPLHLVPELVARLEGERKRPGQTVSTTHMLLHDRTGQRWRSFTFTHVFAEIREAAAKGGRFASAEGETVEIEPMPECARLLWRELRHTAVTELRKAGLDALGISGVTGHTPASAQNILKRHYLIETSKANENAFRARMAMEAGEATAEKESEA